MRQEMVVWCQTMTQQIDRNAIVKRATELLRGGATMLAEACPLCNSPLFKLPSGEVVCPIHGRVMLVKTEEEVSEANVLSTLTELEKSITNKLNMYVNKLKSSEAEFEDARNVIAWLDALERIEKIKRLLSKTKQLETPQTSTRKTSKK